jgi:hypothetical protein
MNEKARFMRAFFYHGDRERHGAKLYSEDFAQRAQSKIALQLCAFP